MCPEYESGICGVCKIAGIEINMIECADEYCCFSNKWEKCRVYMAQFFAYEDEKLTVAA